MPSGSRPCPEEAPPEGLASRRLAWETLVEYSRRDAYLNILLSQRLTSSSLDRPDRAFVSELVRGTVRMLLYLDFALDSFSSRPIESLKDRVRWALRMGAYQIMRMNVPDYAAIHTTVELVKRSVGKGPASFCNGVLRALARGEDEIGWPSKELDPGRHLEIVYSHPRWMVEMWMEELGVDKAEAICRADNEPRPVSVRVNLAKAPREEVAERLRRAGIEVEDSALAEEGLLLKGTGDVASLEEFREGLMSPQDQASMVVGKALGPEPGMSVLDMCAAPGGKANHICEMMQNEGRVLAVDVNGSRLKMVAEAAARLGNEAVQVMVADATAISSLTHEKFDRVLVDAPCTGLGVLGRRPDTRWRRTPRDLQELLELQARLIEEGSRMLAPSGRIVYSTCTISRSENEQNVSKFLETAGSLHALPLEGLPGWNGRELALFPDTEGCDGMFAACLGA